MTFTLSRSVFRAGAILILASVFTVLFLIQAAVAQSGTQYFQYIKATNFTLYPSADGVINLVRTASQAQFFDVDTSNHGLGSTSNAWGTGAVKGSFIVAGRNTSGSGAPGSVLLVDKGGTAYYLWVATTGKLYISTSAPEEDGTPSDTSGTIVGSQ